MNIAFISNLRAPYRTLQLNEFAKIKDVKLNVYYTNSKNDNRKWNTNKIDPNINEFDLNGIKISKTYGYINIGLLKILRQNDIILLGGYEQPTIIILSILCKVFKKPYIIIFDGISCNKLIEDEQKIKKIIKKFIIKNSMAVMANGNIGKRYFKEKFNYPEEKIYNQYLAVDTEKIELLKNDSEKYKKSIREKLNIKNTDKVVIYSGRLIEIKNVDSLIRAISKIKDKDIVLLIVGGGLLEKKIRKLANDLNVRLRITGFLENQEEVFKYYFAGDVIVLPSKVEPWGLVINEAMQVGLPVIVSKNCGCSMDLVKEGKNGYKIDPNDINDIFLKIYDILYKDDIDLMKKESLGIIKKWTFKNSANELNKILNKFF